MRKVLILTVLGFSLVFGTFLISVSESNAAAEGPTCNFIPDATNFSLWSGSVNNTLAQTFVTTFDKVTKVDVKADSLGDFNGSITAAIYYEPEMGVAGITTRSFTEALAPDDYEFTFSSPLDVHAGVTYQLVLWLTDKPNTTGTFYWRVSTDASCYPDGNIKINTVNDYPLLDFGFQVYGYNNAAPPAGDTTPTATSDTSLSNNVSSSIAKPTTLAAAYQDTNPKGVKLTWKASTTADIDGYRIYRSTVKGKSYSKIGQVDKSKLEFVDQAAEASKTYYYIARAYKGAEESASSNEATLTVPANAAPISPQNFRVLSFTDTKIRVAWDKNPEENIASYNLVVTKGEEQVTTATVTAAELEKVFSELQADTEYKITVSAINTAGVSSTPSELTQKTAVAAAEITASKFQMTTLTWILSGIGVALLGLLILLILRRKRLSKKFRI